MAENIRFINDKSKELDEAYRMGEHPLSHWDRKLFDRFIDRHYPDYAERLKKLPVWYLQREFLYHASWHRTGPYYKRTEFFYFFKRFSSDSLDSKLERYKAADAYRRKKKRFEPYTGTQKPCKIVLENGDVMENMLIELDSNGLAAYRIEDLKEAMQKHNEESLNIKNIYPELYHLLREDISDEYNIWDPLKTQKCFKTLKDRTGYFIPKGDPIPRSGKRKAMQEALKVGAEYFFVSSSVNCKIDVFNGNMLRTKKRIDPAIVTKIMNEGIVQFNLRSFLDDVTPYRDFDLYKEKE